MEDLNTYSYDEAFGESLKYFDGDELAARVWVNKYAMKDSFGHIYESRPKTCTGVSRTKSPASRINMRIRSKQKKYSDFLITSNTSFRQVVP